jgi:tetratricopeptide (TPR) repeat protein
MPLEEEDQRHLIAAQGYTELGMHLDANEELEQIDPDVRHAPEVLAVRVKIYRALEKWELMQTVASTLAKYDPDEVQWAVSWAYATRRADSIEAAKGILLHALERHPKEATLHFNLACYDCQLGNLEEAKRSLHKAIKLDARWKAAALKDEDLEPLWNSLTSSWGTE